MTEQASIVVVIDPSQNTQPALEHALRLVEYAKNSQVIKLVFLLTGTSEQTKDVSYYCCSDSWMKENIVDRLEKYDASFSILAAWANDWKDVVLETSREQQAVLTIIPLYDHFQSHILSDEKWKLLRNAQNPIHIAPHKETGYTNKVLCSLKSQDRNYAERNEKVMEAVKNLGELFTMDVHAVNAYTDSMDYPDRGKIAHTTGIDNDHIHVHTGSPQDVICNVANEIDAGLVIVASQQRSGLKGALRGNTVEKIIERVGRDVLIV